jgi:hypothetical protein
MGTTLSIRYGPRRLQPYGFDRWAPPKLIFSAAPRSSLADAYAFVLIELRRDLRRDPLEARKRAWLPDGSVGAAE